MTPYENIEPIEDWMVVKISERYAVFVGTPVSALKEAFIMCPHQMKSYKVINILTGVVEHETAMLNEAIIVAQKLEEHVNQLMSSLKTEKPGELTFH